MKPRGNIYSLGICVCVLSLLSACGTNVYQSHLFGPLNVGINSQFEAKIDVNMEEKLTGTSTATYFL